MDKRHKSLGIISRARAEERKAAGLKPVPLGLGIISKARWEEEEAAKAEAKAVKKAEKEAVKEAKRIEKAKAKTDLQAIKNIEKTEKAKAKADLAGIKKKESEAAKEEKRLAREEKKRQKYLESAYGYSQYTKAVDTAGTRYTKRSALQKANDDLQNKTRDDYINEELGVPFKYFLFPTDKEKYVKEQKAKQAQEAEATRKYEWEHRRK